MRGRVAIAFVLALVLFESTVSFHTSTLTSRQTISGSPYQAIPLQDRLKQNAVPSLQWKPTRQETRLHHSLALDTAVFTSWKISRRMRGMMLILSAILMRVMVRSRRLAYSDSPQRNQNEVDNYDEDSDDENVAILLKNVFVKFVGSVRSTIKDTLRSVKGTLQSIDPPTLPALPNPLDLFGGRIHESDYVDTTDWNVCTLRKRKALSGGYQQYSFSLPNPRGVLDLDLGEEVQLCCVDAKDNVVKESVFPLTKSKQRGQFDVIIQQSGDVATDRFAKALQKCAVGDELAFKGGQRKLRYNEPADPDTRKDGPIELVTLVASSLGIAPAMKMIRTSVEDSDDTTVDEVEVLWVNQDDNDFVCDDDLSALENKFEKQLYVTRLTEPALYDAEADLLTNEDVLSSVSPWEEGRIAMICAPPALSDKFTDFFVTLGYPKETIMTVDTA